jgi:hypothetical protein
VASLSAEVASARARDWLLAAGEAGFVDARHAVTFPQALGFTAVPERQESDLFARAVIAMWLLDTAEDLGGDPALHKLAAAQAEHLAHHRVAELAGGWSYFPGLPELAPDLDSLGVALALFARVAPGHLPLCDGPVALALSQRAADGAIRTFLVADDDPPAPRDAMRRGNDLYWGNTADADALARFHLGLLACGRRDVPVPLAWLAAQQASDGAWRVPWYAGPYAGTSLVLRLFESVAPEHPAARAARDFMARIPNEATPLALAQCRAGPAAREALLALQEPDGSWPPTPWIRMPIGRPSGRIVRELSWQSRAVSTAACMAALVAPAPVGVGRAADNRGP